MVKDTSLDLKMTQSLDFVLVALVCIVFVGNYHILGQYKETDNLIVKTIYPQNLLLANCAL